MTKQPSFVVVTFAIALLVLFAFLARLLQPSIPPPKPNRLIGESSDYVALGAYQPLRWRILDNSAFADASRQGKPIFLVVGSPYSKLARDVDRDAFAFREVQNCLNFHFVCIRVDSLERPDWMNAYLPISRLTTDFLPGLQMWILDSGGRLFGFIGKTRAQDTLDHNVLLGQLENAHSTFERLRRQEMQVPPIQRLDLETIERSPRASPDFRHHMELLDAQEDPLHGGFDAGGFHVPRPNSWRFMLATGQLKSFSKRADAILRTPMVDLMDGGFFRLSETTDWRTVQFDKASVSNAEMMATFSLAGLLTGDRLETYAAERTFDSLTSEFVISGLVAGCRIGDEAELSRSIRSSFPPRKLASALEPADGEWASVNLGLEARSNPRLTPFLASFDVPFGDRDRFDRVLHHLKVSVAQEAPHFGGQGFLDVNGFVAARLIETARRWNDPDRLQKSLNLLEGLERFRINGGVVHGLSGSSRSRAFLSDYLAYSDALLQGFLATGRLDFFERGEKTLLRAQELYAGNVPGVYCLSPRNSIGPTPPDSTVPEIDDNARESCTAQMIRLCAEYGRLLTKDSGSVLGKSKLLDTSIDCIHRFAGITNSTGSQVSGFYCAAAEALDRTYVLTVGPQAVPLAAAVVHRVPLRLVAPAVGPIHREMQRRHPGAYVVSPHKVTGPLVPEQVESLVGATLQPEA